VKSFLLISNERSRVGTSGIAWKEIEGRRSFLSLWEQSQTAGKTNSAVIQALPYWRWMFRLPFLRNDEFVKGLARGISLGCTDLTEGSGTYSFRKLFDCLEKYLKGRRAPAGTKKIGIEGGTRRRVVRSHKTRRVWRGFTARGEKRMRFYCFTSGGSSILDAKKEGSRKIPRENQWVEMAHKTDSSGGIAIRGRTARLYQTTEIPILGDVERERRRRTRGGLSASPRSLFWYSFRRVI